MIKKCFLIMIFVLLFSTLAMAANVVDVGKNSIYISSIDSDYPFPFGVKLVYIFVKPGSGGDDSFYVREYAGGPKIAPLDCSNGDNMAAYFDGIFTIPVLDFANSTLTSGAEIFFGFSRYEHY